MGQLQQKSKPIAMTCMGTVKKLEISIHKVWIVYAIGYAEGKEDWYPWFSFIIFTSASYISLSPLLLLIYFVATAPTLHI
jgi:hypothetical protein